MHTPRPTALLCIFLLSFLLSSAPVTAGALKVVAGTSLIEDIVRDLTNGQAEMITLIPGSSCPGHDTAKTGDFVFAAGADLVLLHSFQRNMPQAVDMMRSVNNADVRTEILESGGSWLVPEVQQRAVRDIAAILAALRPEDAHGIGRRAEKRILEVDRTEEECRAKLSAVDGKAVVVAAMQGEFVRWAGLDVLESYKRAEEMTPRDIALLIDKLRGRAISGVIDNYQSGANTGLPLALELEIPHIVLSNFPGSSEDTPDYFHLLRHNVEQLLKLGR